VADTREYVVLHYPYRSYTMMLPQFNVQILHLCLLSSGILWQKYTDVQDSYTNTNFSLESVEKCVSFYTASRSTTPLSSIYIIFEFITMVKIIRGFLNVMLFIVRFSIIGLQLRIRDKDVTNKARSVSTVSIKDWRKDTLAHAAHWPTQSWEVWHRIT
jgi:hypothetical protein